MITRVFIASLVLVASTSTFPSCSGDDDVTGTSQVQPNAKEGGEARSRKLRYQIAAEDRSLIEMDKAAEVNVHLVPMQVLKGLYGMPGIDPKDLRQQASTTTRVKNEAASATRTGTTKDLPPGLRIRYTEIEIPKRKDLQALSSKRSPLLIRLLDESNSVDDGSGPEPLAVVQQPRGFSSTSVQEINDLLYQNQQQQQQQVYHQQQQPQYQSLEQQQQQVFYQQQQQQVDDPQYQSLGQQQQPQQQIYHEQQQVSEPQYQSLEQHQQPLEEQQNHLLVQNEEPRVKQVIVSGDHRTPEEAQPESEGHFSEVGDPNYQFSYAVRDADKGADFGHEESKSEGRTSGQYWLTLPDGRRQRVRYWADSKGFRATVHYSDP